MRIFADLTQLMHYPCGIATYIITLYKTLMAKYQDVEITTGENCLRPATIRQFTQRVHELLSPAVKVKGQPFPSRLHLFEHPLLMRFLGLPTDKYDICHITANFADSSFPVRNWNNVVMTIHDLFVFHPEYHSQPLSQWHQEYRKYIKTQAEKARQIITVSQFTKNEIVELLRISPEKITVIPNAVQWSPEQMKDSDAYLACVPQTSQYYMAVSNIAPHKNYETLLEAWDRFRTDSRYNQEKLVIVGTLDASPISEKIKHTPGIIHLQKIPPETLYSLYSHALGAFSLAFFEGFGIPLLEAMTCGCPACYAIGNSMTEIGRNAAFAVHPKDVNAIAEYFDRFRQIDNTLKQHCKEERTIAAEYSWQNTVQATWNVFQKVAK